MIRGPDPAEAKAFRPRGPAMIRRLVVSIAVAGWLFAAPVGVARSWSPARLVNPFSGTAAGAPDFGTGGGAANTFPGAVAPFGMLTWSPNTLPDTVNFAGGYSYPDHELSGFSLTHLSGGGCAAGGDISFLPTTHPVTVAPAMFGSSNVNPVYVPSFSHSQESASPGYYQVELDPGTRGSIDAELTATTRAGAGRFTFPATSSASVLINAGASANADTDASVQIDPATQTVTGSASSGRFCYQRNAYTVYFAARFSRPFSTYGTWTLELLSPHSTSSRDSNPAAINYTPIPGGPPSIPGNPSGTAQSGAYLTFGTASDRVVEVRVGLSYVSAADALQNLDDETGTRTFDRLRASATATWNRALGAVRVGGGTVRDRRTFYTALYHALLEPSVFSDDNGSYMGMDGHVHTVAPGHIQYANYSEWDIYRSEMPLLAMLDPARASDMVQSLVSDAAQSGWLPKWPVADGQTDVMVGDSADPIIADAYAFGARSFDTAAALAAMVKGATQSGISANGEYVERPGLADYEQLGYVPHELNGTSLAATLVPTTPWGSVSTTLEYATDDFSLAQFADRALCDSPVYRQFMSRSGDWANVYDPSISAMAARSLDGAFVSGSGQTSTDDFVEGDAAQYTWMVPFDLAGLFAHLGGIKVARERLDAFFTELNSGPASSTAFLGNEPTLEAPWEYDWLGEPFRTEQVVRQALLTLYGPGPADYPGNDDLGEMSSWYVLSAIGLYPEIPGAPVLALGSPLFPHITLRLGPRRVQITAPAASDATPYVHGLRVHGRAWTRPWITYRTLASAQTVNYRLSATPDRRWGSSPNATPPSFQPTSERPTCSTGLKESTRQP
jgi:predicted alpha-1,2-mannosidase